MTTNDAISISEQDVPASTPSIIRSIPHWVFCVSLIVSCIAWMQTKKHFDIVANERFTSRLALIKSKIENRMLDYDQVLRSGVALHDSSREVSRKEWKQFFSSCETQTWLPGIQCIGVAVPVAKQDVSSFEKSIQQEGFPEFKISPQGIRDDYTAVKFIEPFDWRNRRAFGFDMYSNPVRRKAMDRAAETGLPSISGKITLAQETNDDVQPGILCYLPIYRRGASVETVAERKRALTGWVYAAFRCNDLMAAVLGEHAQEMSLEIFDTEATTAGNILFDSQPAERSVESQERTLSAVVPINLSGRIWTMHLKARPEFFIHSESLFSTAVGVVGLLFSILLYLLLISFTRQRERAIESARRMTRGLVESERKTRSILENASEAILSVSDNGEIANANRAAHNVFAVTGSLIKESINDFLATTKFNEMAEQCCTNDGSVLTTCLKANGEEFQCSISMGEVTMTNNLHYIVMVKDETLRIAAAKKLAEKNKQLVLASRNAGMAEVATGVLHNVGNVLNSVNVSTSILEEKLNSRSISVLKKGVDLLNQHESDLVEFLTKDDRGKHFPEFIGQITKALITERDTQLDEVNLLVKNIEHIRGIVTAQQSSASCSRIVEPIQLASLIKSAIKVNDALIFRHRVQLITRFSNTSTVFSEEHPILQILINLIKNAMEACSNRESSLVSVTTAEESHFVRIDIADNGVGISSEQLKSLFQHGFTTKPNGHGFGLHSAAITATELGGSLTAHSDGLDEGAVFTLRIPFTKDESSAKPTKSDILVIDNMTDSVCRDILQGS